MNEALLSRCLSVTDDLCRRPISTFLLGSGVPNLASVRDSLIAGEYASPGAWYSALCAVFDEAIASSPPDSLRRRAAEHGLAEARRLACGLDCSTPTAWYSRVQLALRKLSRAIAESPVPQGIDPSLLTILRRARARPSPAPRNLPDIAARATAAISDERVRSDVVSILKEADPGLALDADALRIDLGRAPACAADALLRYFDLRGASGESDMSHHQVFDG